jgi:hypothetical protein
MRLEEFKPGYEEVFTVTDYYDGPRQGVANFGGKPHFYDCIFDESMSNYSDLYRLTPITKRIFELAKEDWSIWERWEAVFHAGNASRESRPALPQDRARLEEIRTVLDSALKTDESICAIRAGSFDTTGTSVRWTEPGRKSAAGH